MTTKPITFERFTLESLTTQYTNNDHTLWQYCREMEVFLKRGGAGIGDDKFQEISDYIDGMSCQTDNHPVVDHQLEQARNLFDQCLPFQLEQEQGYDNFLNRPQQRGGAQ